MSIEGYMHIGRAIALIVVLHLFLTSVVHAQNRSQQRMIDEIQQNPAFIFAVGSDRNAEDAHSSAIIALTREVSSAYRTASSTLSSAGYPRTFRGRELNELAQTMTWQNGRTHFTMAYIDRADARETFIKERLGGIVERSDMHWGLAHDREAGVAENLARTSLLSGIQVTIMTEQNLIQTDDGITVTDEFQNRVRAFSNLTLQGLQTVGPMKMDDVYVVFTYLTPEGLQQSMENTRNIVLSFVREGERNEGAGQFSRALQQYYKAFIYTSSYLGSMQGTIDGEEILDMRIALRNRIRNILDAAAVRSRPAFEASRGTTITRFELIRDSYRFSNLFYQFNFENTSISEEITFGEGQISFQNYIPGRLQEIFSISLNISLGSDIYSDAYLASMEPLVRLTTSIDVPVNFRNVVRVDIQPEPRDGDVLLRLQPRNLMIRSARWVINDGVPQFGTEVSIPLQGQGIIPLTVEINGEEELTFERWYNHETRQISLVRPDITPAPILASAPPAIPAPAPVVMPAVPAFQQFSVIQRQEQSLFQIRNWNRLLSELQRKASEGKLSFGPSDDFDDKNGLVAIVFDRNNVYDYLYHEEDHFKSFITQTVYRSLDELESGSGERFLAWIKFE